MHSLSKVSRSFFSLLLTASFVAAPLFGLLSHPLTVSAAGEIEITTWEELAGMVNNLDADYILMNDLGPSDVGYDQYASSTSNMGTGWVPIGDSTTSFSGSFDGQGHTISGLTINRGGERNGLFGSVIDGYIRNVDVVYSTIEITDGSYFTGIVVGYADGLVMENVHANGNITTNGVYAGGLIGISQDTDASTPTLIIDSSADVDINIELDQAGGLIGGAYGPNTIIKSSFATGDVTTEGQYAGGFIGRSDDVKIYNSYATGAVVGDSNSYSIGGFIGYSEQTFIFDSYATGNVEGYTRVGGFIGDNWYSIIANVFSIGTVTPLFEGNDVGGLIGESDIAVDYSLTGSFMNEEANSGLAIVQDSNGYYGLDGLTEAEFTDESIFTEMGWDFENVWVMGEYYPELRESISYFQGGGTEEDPYELGDSCAQLSNARFFPEAHYKLMQDMDCSETADWHDGYGFMGIAYPFEDYKFTGTFDGNDKTITGIIMDQAEDYTGFFRHIDAGAEVYDLTLDNARILGDDRVGVLAGGLEGTVTNVHVNGYVQGDNAIGGLVGVHAEGYGLSNSSPLVYSWDGDSYEYVADVGEMIARGTDGEDFTVIDADKIAPKDDVYSINISQEYNEIVYYDKLSLMLFEHAPGYTVVEPMLREVSYDTLTTVNDTPSHPLLACEDMYGNDCTNDLREYDDAWSYKDDSDVNEWVMDFGDLSGAERIQLVLRAARDYEATPDYDHRTVSVIGPDGEWVQIYGRKELGSDGTPRLRTIDLTGKFLTDDYRVKFGFDRLRVNSIAIDTSLEQEFTMQEIAPTKADLSFRGYTAIDKTFFNDHDYDTVSAVPPESFANQIGNFTKYGDVLPLITEAEDQFVIMRHGDHVEYEFPYQGDVTPGKERSYILFSDVVYKHATEDTGRTVLPLPYQGMESYPSDGYPMTPENEEYLRTWNTRVYDGPIGGGSTIIDSSANVDVIGGSDSGGLVGHNQKLITGSFATGYVSGDYNTGGLVGYSETGSQIIESYAANEFPEDESIITRGQAPVEGFCYVGGLVGGHYNDAVIEDSYAYTSVYAVECNVGGLVGEIYSATVDNAYSVGEVLGGTNSGYAGGSIGYAYYYGITDSFWDVQTNASLSACGNEQEYDCDTATSTKPVSLAQMSTAATFTTELGDQSWDFAEIWGINSTDNGGYPFLRWQNFENEEVAEPEPEEEDNGPRRNGSRRQSSSRESSRQSTRSDDVTVSVASVPQSTASVSTPAVAASIGTVRDLTIGSTGEDVLALQKLLNTLGYTLAPSGAGSPGSETTLFGGLTKAALSKYQADNGIVPSIGYFGPLTRTQMKSVSVPGLWW